MSETPEELRARIAAIKAKMAGGSAPSTPAAPAQPAPAAPATPAAAPAGGAAAGGDMAAKIAAIKAKMAGGAAPAAPAAAATAKPAAPAAAAAATAVAPASEADMQARIAALKAKMESGKGVPVKPTAPGSAAAAAPAPTRPPAKAAAGKAIWPVQPVDRTSFGEDRLYGPATLNRWFTISGALLLVMVVFMLRHDWVRDWKGFQAEFREIKIERGQQAVAAADAAIDKGKLKQLEDDLAKAKSDVAANQATEDRLQAEWNKLDGEVYAKDQDFKFAKSEFDALRYSYEEERVKHGGDKGVLADSDAKMDAKKKDLEARQAASDAALKARDDKKAEIDALLARETNDEKALAALTDQRDAAVKRLAKIDHNVFNDYVRNAPIADMLAPTEKIDQIVLDKLKDNYNFMYVGKIDRCTTCHVGIADGSFSGPDWDKPGSRVFMAHPRLDLFVADNSPHPMGKFGCTVCHQGRGQAVEFPRTFHVPVADAFETEAQKQERWTKDYGFDEHRHYWDWPMVPGDKLYSACFQCHQGTDRIEGVPQYNDSRALVEKLGCYGCHKIEGFEHLRKPAPDLAHIAAKTTEDWARKWVLSPRAFRPTTRMPQFFNQSNTGGTAGKEIVPGIVEVKDDGHPWNNDTDKWVPDWRARNDVEARAIIAYVFAQSRDALAKDGYQPVPAPAAAGDAAKGKDLFAQRGCLGCHSMARDNLVENTHGPDLSHVGSKVNAAWLFDWLKNPTHYWATTVMPNLRLTDEEAADIAAYVLSGRDPEWEARPQPKPDDKLLDGIAVEYQSAAMGVKEASDIVAKLRADGGSKAVEHYVGEKLFARYGCSGCHSVPGHEADNGIGTELTKEGLKDIARLDYGFEADVHNPQAIPFTRHDFFRAKLHDPRVFDRMPVVEGEGTEGAKVVRYDQKLKAPGDKLKMPNFYLADAEIELVTQFLMGLRDEGTDISMKRTLSADEQVLENASRLITERNCTGCHKLGQVSAPLALDEAGVGAGAWLANPLKVPGEGGPREVAPRRAWLQDEIYDPWGDEDTDTLDFFKAHPPAGPVLAYGAGEGRIGKFIDTPAMRPPVLRNEGAKVNPDWLFGFLLSPFTVRNHVQVRMPTFGFTEEQAMGLTRWFASRADQPWPFQTDKDATVNPDLVSKGQDLFNKNKCNSCHPAGAQVPSNPDKTNWGPDLSMAQKRLKGDWISEWLQNPQAFQPGTKMPNFFGEMKDGKYKVFVEGWDEQVRALRHFLKHMDQAQTKPVTKS